MATHFLKQTKNQNCMKWLILMLLSFSVNVTAHCQIFKKLGKELESDARWKVRMKANRKMDQAIDTVLAQPKKIINKKDKSSEKKPSNDQSQSTGGGMNASVKTSNDDGSSQGYVTISLSAYEIFKGGTVIISGNSLKYGSFTDVKLNIVGPAAIQNTSSPLNESNAYKKEFLATNAGEYTITATSSNGKTKQSAKLKVLEKEMMQWNDNIQA